MGRADGGKIQIERYLFYPLRVSEELSLAAPVCIFLEKNLHVKGGIEPWTFREQSSVIHDLNHYATWA
jgi:hypothetical protein